MPAREMKEVRNAIKLPGHPWLWAEQTCSAAGDLVGFKRNWEVNDKFIGREHYILGS